jgi:hypothetical protein
MALIEQFQTTDLKPFLSSVSLSLSFSLSLCNQHMLHFSPVQIEMQRDLGDYVRLSRCTRRTIVYDGRNSNSENSGMLKLRR